MICHVLPRVGGEKPRSAKGGEVAGPDPAVAAVRVAVRRVLPPVGLVLVACSGGADSLALAAALAHETRGRPGLRAGLVTIDHGLQVGSAAQAATVLDQGRRLGLDPLRAIAVDVPITGGGVEEAARDARLAALLAEAEHTGAVAVLLGHTRDDQAEQVLLGLARGSGTRSLAGIPPRRGPLLRPLLDLPRATTMAACAALGLQAWQDPHNADRSFARVRARDVLPLLDDALGPGIAAALARSAALLRADADALDALAAEAHDNLTGGPAGTADAAGLEPAGLEPAGLPVQGLAALPAALRSRVLRRAAATAGARALTAGQTADVDALVTAWRGQGRVALPGGVSAYRSGDRVVVRAL